jgi:hypothetical protein
MRRAVNTVVVANRLKELNEGFELYLKKRQNDEPDFPIHPGQDRVKATVADWETGKPFAHFYEVGDLVSQHLGLV